MPGASLLLVDLLEATRAKIRLVGHSYGGQVVLSATCVPRSLPRKVDSMLLLQPAVSHLCFAAEVPKRHGAGAYRAALDRVRLPHPVHLQHPRFPAELQDLPTSPSVAAWTSAS